MTSSRLTWERLPATARDQPSALVFFHHPIEIAALHEVVVFRVVRVRLRATPTAEHGSVIVLFARFDRTVVAVRFVVLRTPAVVVEAHRAVAAVVSRAGSDALRRVHGKPSVIDAETVPCASP